MLVNQAVQLATLALAVLAGAGPGGARAAPSAPSSFRVCGRKLGEIMSRVCHVYNGPSWDVPTVVEQPAAAVRRRRDTGGIADECCNNGCTWEQLEEYCSVSTNSDSLLEETHMIADRSAEQETAPKGEVAAPAQVRTGAGRRGRAGGARGRRRCRCRKRRSGRRRASLLGNMELVRNVARAAPVVGTVSPLLTWGRTLNTDLPMPPIDRDRYAYVAVYST